MMVVLHLILAPTTHAFVMMMRVVISMLTFTAYHLLSSLVIKDNHCSTLSDASLGVLLPAYYDSTLWLIEMSEMRIMKQQLSNA